MAREQRKGNRRKRDQASKRRPLELGYYIIVTDTECTEKNYFLGLKASLPADVQSKLAINVINTKTDNLVSKCVELMEYDPQYRIPWIVFDRDQVGNFDAIIKQAEDQGINVGWSNPCFEIWMYAYFGKMPVIQESWSCCTRFAVEFVRRTGNEYSKNDSDIYRKLTSAGDEDTAIKIAKRKYYEAKINSVDLPSKMLSCSTVFNLVEDIRGKVN
ncbi:RloB-like protein [Ruminococcaceae bacterium YRB3002]|nr:RloB-like protein [Ruminococcaceae bacterium YRB3002]